MTGLATLEADGLAVGHESLEKALAVVRKWDDDWRTGGPDKHLADRPLRLTVSGLTFARSGADDIWACMTAPYADWPFEAGELAGFLDERRRPPPLIGESTSTASPSEPMTLESITAAIDDFRGLPKPALQRVRLVASPHQSKGEATLWVHPDDFAATKALLDGVG